MGDVILSIDGEPAGDGRRSMNQVARIKPTDKVTVQVMRNGKELKLTAEIGLRPPPAPVKEKKKTKPGPSISGISRTFSLDMLYCFNYGNWNNITCRLNKGLRGKSCPRAAGESGLSRRTANPRTGRDQRHFRYESATGPVDGYRAARSSSATKPTPPFATSRNRSA
jgi:hypothetical protein